MFRTTFCLIALAAAAPAAHGQAMQITRAGEEAGRLGDADQFTGDAYIEPVFGATEPFAASAASVTFLPGARTHWHSHPRGQRLVVTSGTGWTQVRGGPRETIRAGDVVWCPPETEHWHGATDTVAMTHLAIQPAENGVFVRWGEAVSDAAYLD